MATATTELPARPTAAIVPVIPPLENGDHLDQKTFHERYAAMPDSTRAELIGGRVYLMASPVFKPHGGPHGRIVTWIGIYQAATPGTDFYDNTSTILGRDSEPQPDACLLILPECGGQTRRDDELIDGTPELVVEIASSSESYDLHEKRADYERYGVREYVVYAARQQRVYWWVRRGDRYEELSAGSDGVFRSETFPGLWLDAAALVQADGAKMHEVLRQGLARPEHADFVANLEAVRKTP
jgi:Uma2 family endonuclease